MRIHHKGTAIHTEMNFDENSVVEGVMQLKSLRSDSYRCAVSQIFRIGYRKANLSDTCLSILWRDRLVLGDLERSVNGELFL